MARQKLRIAPRDTIASARIRTDLCSSVATMEVKLS